MDSVPALTFLVLLWTVRICWTQVRLPPFLMRGQGSEGIFRHLVCHGSMNPQIIERLLSCAVGLTDEQRLGFHMKLRHVAKEDCYVTTMSGEDLKAGPITQQQPKPKTRRKKIVEDGAMNEEMRRFLLEAGMDPAVEETKIELEVVSTKEKPPEPLGDKTKHSNEGSSIFQEIENERQPETGPSMTPQQLQRVGGQQAQVLPPLFTKPELPQVGRQQPVVSAIYQDILSERKKERRPLLNNLIQKIKSQHVGGQQVPPPQPLVAEELPHVGSETPPESRSLLSQQKLQQAGDQQPSVQELQQVGGQKVHVYVEEQPLEKDDESQPDGSSINQDVKNERPPESSPSHSPQEPQQVGGQQVQKNQPPVAKPAIKPIPWSIYQDIQAERQPQKQVEQEAGQNPEKKPPTNPQKVQQVGGEHAAQNPVKNPATNPPQVQQTGGQLDFAELSKNLPKFGLPQLDPNDLKKLASLFSSMNMSSLMNTKENSPTVANVVAIGSGNAVVSGSATSITGKDNKSSVKETIANVKHMPTKPTTTNQLPPASKPETVSKTSKTPNANQLPPASKKEPSSKTPVLHESSPLSIMKKSISKSGHMNEDLKRALVEAGMDPNNNEANIAFEVTSVKRKMLGENEKDVGEALPDLSSLEFSDMEAFARKRADANAKAAGNRRAHKGVVSHKQPAVLNVTLKGSGNPVNNPLVSDLTNANAVGSGKPKQVISHQHPAVANTAAAGSGNSIYRPNAVLADNAVTNPKTVGGEMPKGIASGTGTETADRNRNPLLSNAVTNPKTVGGGMPKGIASGTGTETADRNKNPLLNNAVTNPKTVGGEMPKGIASGTGTETADRNRNPLLSKEYEHITNAIKPTNTSPFQPYSNRNRKHLPRATTTKQHLNNPLMQKEYDTNELSKYSNAKHLPQAVTPKQTSNSPVLRESSPLSVMQKSITKSGQMSEDLKRTLVQAGMDPKENDADIDLEVTSVKRKMLGANDQDTGGLAEPMSANHLNTADTMGSVASFRSIQNSGPTFGSRRRPLGTRRSLPRKNFLPEMSQFETKPNFLPSRVTKNLKKTFASNGPPFADTHPAPDANEETDGKLAALESRRFGNIPDVRDVPPPQLQLQRRKRWNYIYDNLQPSQTNLQNINPHYWNGVSLLQMEKFEFCIRGIIPQLG